MEQVDVAIVGGGHNGLVAAAYLARAGLDVLVLERLPHTGGAAVSERVFAGVDARLSRYSYLVSLLPDRIRRDLDVAVPLVRRRYSSYTPVPGTDVGLLVDTGDPAATAASFARIGAEGDLPAFATWQRDLGELAAAVWPTMVEPLPSRSALRERVGERLWAEFFERPIGETLRRRFRSDLLRGVIATDALIGTFASLDDPDLAQNVCLLYHVVGGGTGDWDVPVGGMGAVTDALAAAALAAGARIRTDAEVAGVEPDGTVRGAGFTVRADRVLVNAAPSELARLLDEGAGDVQEGAQIKVNMLLSRLPRLRDPDVSVEAAFGGTFHVHESLSELETAHTEASAGRLPAPVPVELYCHSLADRSILGPELAASGAQTLTAFALQVPHRLGIDRATAQAAVLASLDDVLAEPVEQLLLRGPDGTASIETRTTADLEAELRLPGGNIFHAPLEFPFRSATGAEGEWGVRTAHERILLCGSGSTRGGGVSGLGGYAAAQAVLAER
jgi:phytoene dehydrogenase-like protein